MTKVTKKKETNVYNSQEIPKLELSVSEICADLVQRDFHLTAQGWTMEEALLGFEFLMQQKEKLKGKK